MNELSKKNLIELDTITATGKKVGENIKGCINKNPNVIRPIDNPYMQTGGGATLPRKAVQSSRAPLLRK